MSSTDVEQRLRSVGDRVSGFFVRPLLAIGITADHLTLAGVAFSLWSGWCLYNGWTAAAGMSLLLLGACDWLDGQLARASGTAGPRGALLDSTTDRLSDAVPFIALMLSPHSPPPVVWLSVGALLVGILIPYIKARAESLGCKLHGALLPRAPRFILLLTGVFAGPLVLLVCLALIAVLGTVTIGQRLRQAFTQLAATS